MEYKAKHHTNKFKEIRIIGIMTPAIGFHHFRFWNKNILSIIFVAQSAKSF
jgi:hypothetical protein